MNQIIRDVEGDLSLKGDQMLKPITCHVLDYARFVEVYDADGTHRQALLDKGVKEAAEQEAAAEAKQSNPDATVRMLQVRRPATRPRPSARRGDGPRTVRRAQCQRALT